MRRAPRACLHILNIVPCYERFSFCVNRTLFGTVAREHGTRLFGSRLHAAATLIRPSHFFRYGFVWFLNMLIKYLAYQMR